MFIIPDMTQTNGLEVKQTEQLIMVSVSNTVTFWVDSVVL